MYFEDYEIGRETQTRSRTVTEADIVNFAGLTGDFHQLHMSEEWAKAGPFGRRIAHGALVFSISTGLTIQMGDIDEIIAFYGVEKLRFVNPTFIGDTIHVVKKVLAKEPKGPGRGVVTMETRVLKQTGDPVCVYVDKVLVKART